MRLSYIEHYRDMNFSSRKFPVCKRATTNVITAEVQNDDEWKQDL